MEGGPIKFVEINHFKTRNVRWRNSKRNHTCRQAHRFLLNFRMLVVSGKKSFLFLQGSKVDFRKLFLDFSHFLLMLIHTFVGHKLKVVNLYKGYCFSSICLI